MCTYVTNTYIKHAVISVGLLTQTNNTNIFFNVLILLLRSYIILNYSTCSFIIVLIYERFFSPCVAFIAGLSDKAYEYLRPRPSTHYCHCVRSSLSYCYNTTVDEDTITKDKGTRIYKYYIFTFWNL